MLPEVLYSTHIRDESFWLQKMGITKYISSKLNMKVVIFYLKFNGLVCRTCYDLPAVKEVHWAYPVLQFTLEHDRLRFI